MTHIALHDTNDLHRIGISTVLTDAGYTVQPGPGPGRATGSAPVPTPRLPTDVAVRPGQPQDEPAADVSVVALRDPADWRALHKLSAVGAPLVALLTTNSTDGVALDGPGAILPLDPSPSVLLAALTLVLTGLQVLPISALLNRLTPALLSGAERDWLRQLAAGTPISTLAVLTGLPERSCYRRLALLYRKLGATSRQEALVHAARAGLL